ncbi:MAG: hypothetical protein A3J09_02185 [Candidatus Zambryskibacteria bacterium RIFCSPLOWO2_02_FULL_51_21]|uniref:Uncharacterized protein n=1 Tax=Candidatus Zambryskibacteria bacterium RIFCSPHIGHO2_02_FULL_43_37 TaxID=1802749 RepID=A0A1G2TH67_9BACT|nr:MAG: hypothetical protein A2723_02185 [Candidatus Zambryskibacteria bacterium RIFCSPHIGHO2_01_FULL_52_18]OHA96398.1 MAG: hypothetical protein A3D49_00715 [Candidatus Zambryskibacteria bacterium RIFCSPHIGHO2_02_FULL_43_37]OHB07797.1 MAG: hypothetical protein A2944_00575 [Candidatus Zambryskibacteria bacterium RIFCSPLOWO2_01_FULL_52_12]OHB11342.1 MAG: hypothetical protein A3J09_02185 [Candidatus Zambryskibacteria bacterium RIFCSPLOWO2_02_FULL_51_21]
MFKCGDKVQLVEKPKRRGKSPIPLVVLEDRRSEIVLKDEETNETVTFAHMTQYDGWKMLFPDMEGKRCFSQRGPTYDIVKA